MRIIAFAALLLLLLAPVAVSSQMHVHDAHSVLAGPSDSVWTGADDLPWPLDPGASLNMNDTGFVPILSLLNLPGWTFTRVADPGDNSYNMVLRKYCSDDNTIPCESDGDCVGTCVTSNSYWKLGFVANPRINQVVMSMGVNDDFTGDEVRANYQKVIDALLAESQVDEVIALMSPGLRRALELSSNSKYLERYSDYCTTCAEATDVENLFLDTDPGEYGAEPRVVWSRDCFNLFNSAGGPELPHHEMWYANDAAAESEGEGSQDVHPNMLGQRELAWCVLQHLGFAPMDNRPPTPSLALSNLTSTTVDATVTCGSDPDGDSYEAVLAWASCNEADPGDTHPDPSCGVVAADIGAYDGADRLDTSCTPSTGYGCLAQSGDPAGEDDLPDDFLCTSGQPCTISGLYGNTQYRVGAVCVPALSTDGSGTGILASYIAALGFLTTTACSSSGVYTISDCFPIGSLASFSLDAQWSDLWTSDTSDNEADFDTSGTPSFRSALYWSAETANSDQVVGADLSAVPSSGSWNFGLSLRYDPDPDHDSERYHVEAGSSGIRWRTFSTESPNAFEDIDDYGGSFTGPYLIARVTGTGASETRQIWDFAAAPGDPDSLPTSGAACTSDPDCNAFYETTGDPGQWGIDSGGYVGFRGFGDTQGEALSVTEFLADNVNQAPTADFGGPYSFGATSGAVACAAADDGLGGSDPPTCTLTIPTPGTACASATYSSSGTATSSQCSDTLEGLVDGGGCTIRCVANDGSLDSADADATVVVSTTPSFGVTPTNYDVFVNEGSACPTRQYTITNSGASGAYTVSESESEIDLTGATAGTLGNGQSDVFQVVDADCASLTAAGSPYVLTVSYTGGSVTYTVNVSVSGANDPVATLVASGAGTAQASSITGDPPLLVYFEGIATTDPDETKPKHHLTYCFDAGDGNTEAYALATHKTVRKAKWCGGPEFAYVYEAGSCDGGCTATLTVYDPEGHSDTATVTVTTNDLDSASVVCVADSAGADFTGCPAGATQQTEGDSGYEDFDNAVATGCGSFDHVLFQGGGTFSFSSTVDVTCKGVGVYNRASGGRVTLSGSGVSVLFDVGGDNRRVYGFDYTGSGSEDLFALDKSTSSDSDFVLIWDSKLRNINRISNLSHSTQGMGASYVLNDVVGVFENDIEDFGNTSGVALIVGARHFALVGNRLVDPNQKKILRTNHVGADAAAAGGGFITANVFQGCDEGACMTLRGADTSGVAEGCATCWTENLVVADNWIEHAGSDKINLCGRNASTYHPKGRDYIYERNYSTVKSGTQFVSNFIRCKGDGGPRNDYTVRNNIIDMRTSSSNTNSVFSDVGDVAEGSSGFEVYNNVIFGYASTQTFWNRASGPGCVFANNLFWSSSGGASFFSGSACSSQSANWDADGTGSGLDTGIEDLAACPFTDCGSTTDPSNFKITTASESNALVDGGSAVPNGVDFLQQTRLGGTLDVGAFERESGADPPLLLP